MGLFPGNTLSSMVTFVKGLFFVNHEKSVALLCVCETVSGDMNGNSRDMKIELNTQ